MKCVHCGMDNTYAQRGVGGCYFCKKRFVFEPKRGDVFTDLAFQNAIDRVSSQGHVRWGREHLRYELCRPKKRAAVWALLAPAVISFVILLLTAALWGVLFWILAWGGISAALLLWKRARLTLSEQAFNALFARWTTVNGQPKGLIVPRPELPAARRPVEADIPDYSFDRAVICDRARTADLLLANNFHFENNCAVLAYGGYPPHAFDMVLGMLRRNPRLVVYVLHDATPFGCTLAERVARDPAWFRGTGARIVEVGLQVAHARKFRGLWERAQDEAGVPHELRMTLGAKDLEWLAKYSLELAAIRPEQVIKRLYRAITHADQLPESVAGGGDGGSTVIVDGWTMTTESSASDGGADSFG